MVKTILLLFFTCMFLSFTTQAQTLVTITGKAYDKDDTKLPLPKLMIINKRTNLGTFADSEGKFSLSVFKSDTLLFSAVGFMMKKICLKDSADKKQYNVEIPLQKLQFTLKEVSVFAPRNLSDIQKDINNLGIKRTRTVDGLDAISSPITYLYERFSKFGRARQKVAEWEDEDMKRDILKDLFRLYVKHDVIDLSDDDFDAFVKYLNLSDEFIQTATQFELVMAIKGKYESFKYRWR
jgi:hypothetical protein